MAEHYAVRFTNDTAAQAGYCVYMAAGDMPFYSLAWLVGECAAGASAAIEWRAAYSFVLCDRYDVLKPGDVPRVDQMVDADPYDKGANARHLKCPGSPHLNDGFPGYPGGLVIMCGSDVPFSKSMAGFGMEGRAALLCPTRPNYVISLKAPPTFRIVAGAFAAGAVLDPDVLGDAVDLGFSPDGDVADVVLESDGKLRIR